MSSAPATRFLGKLNGAVDFLMVPEDKAAREAHLPNGLHSARLTEAGRSQVGRLQPH